MEPLRFNYKNSIIAYYRFGSGLKQVICFHGYGEDATTFEFLSKYAGNQFTFYAIDLPFHGKTVWKDQLTFTESDLVEITQKILHQDNQKSKIENQKLLLLGFSLGGRIALSLYQSMSEKIENLILLAPDGLKVNFWYWLSTQTWLGNKFFAFTMKHPGWFFMLLKLLHKLKLVNTSIYKFCTHYVNDAQARQVLYTRWTTLRKLKPNISGIKKLIKENKTPVSILYGRHDRIILSSVGEKFKKGIEEQCVLTIIHSGHQVLHEKHVKEIVESLSLVLRIKNF